MSNTLQTVDQFRFFLKSHGIDINNYKYTEEEEKNLYGIKGIKPVQNPYLWNRLMNFDIGKEAVAFLVNYKKEWINVDIIISILQGKPKPYKKDCDLSRNIINQLLDALDGEDKLGMINYMGQIISSVINQGSKRILEILIRYAKSNDIDLNQNKSFMVNILPEATKTGEKEFIRFLLNEYPDTIRYSEDWPYLNAMKKGFYDIALFFLKNGNDVHAKNDLGYKLLEKNDRNGIVPFTKESKEAHDFIMDVYRGNAFI